LVEKPAEGEALDEEEVRLFAMEIRLISTEARLDLFDRGAIARGAINRR